MIHVGILSLQGSVAEHHSILRKIEGVNPLGIKYRQDLEQVDALILPGGESTTIGKLLRDFDLVEPLNKRIEEGMPVWGTCAGLILLAKEVDGEPSDYLSVMDIHAKRNAYGTQSDSFTVREPIEAISSTPIPLVFIRAPYIVEANEDVEILKEVRGNIVAARQENMLVTSFHPELTNDLSVHKYFLSMVE